LPCLADILVVTGGAAEVGGLILVVAEIINVQRREFPEHRGWVTRTLAWLRRVFRRTPSHVYMKAGTGVATASGGGATVTVGKPGPAPTLEERVERLERDTRALAEQASMDRDEMRQSVREAIERGDKAARELRTLIEERDQARREGLRDALLLQKIGTAAFIVGVGLSVTGNLVSCQ
jgi:hypothetical protein